MDYNILTCLRCRQPYDVDQNIPLVLKCGHSLCMHCVLGSCYKAIGKLECGECESSEVMTLAKVRELPPNKTLLQFLNKPESLPPISLMSLGTDKPDRFSTPNKRFSTPTTAYTRNAFTPGPSTRFLSFEDTPYRSGCRQPGCIHQQRYVPGAGMNSPYCSEHLYIPPTETRPFYLGEPVMTSTNSVSLKCARDGCMNDKYCLQGQVFEYCSINCFDQENRRRYLT